MRFKKCLIVMLAMLATQGAYAAPFSLNKFLDSALGRVVLESRAGRSFSAKMLGEASTRNSDVDSLLLIEMLSNPVLRAELPAIERQFERLASELEATLGKSQFKRLAGFSAEISAPNQKDIHRLATKVLNREFIEFTATSGEGFAAAREQFVKANMPIHTGKKLRPDPKH